MFEVASARNMVTPATTQILLLFFFTHGKINDQGSSVRKYVFHSLDALQGCLFILCSHH